MPASASFWRRVFPGTPSVTGAIGVLTFAVLVLFAFPAQGKLLHQSLSGMDSIVQYLIGHFAELVELLLFAWMASRLERRSFADYGLPWRPALRSRFWQGTALGIGLLAALVFALSAVGGLRLAMPAHVTPATPLYGAGYLLIFIVLGLREEFLYRGYGLSALAGQIGFWPAAVVSSAWFVRTHAGNSGETVLGLLAVGLFGILACVMLWRTGNLWLPIGMHAAWDWGETFLFGVSDSGHGAAPGHFFTATTPAGAPAWLSGAATGPEGSVLCVAMLVALIVVFAGWRRRS